MKIKLLIISLALASCTEKIPTTEETAKANIEAHFIKSAHDPESYEFVEMGKLDTIYLAEHLNEMITLYQDQVDNMSGYPELIATSLDHAQQFRKLGSKYVSDAKDAEDRAKDLQDLMDKANNSLQDYKNRLAGTAKDSIMELNTSFQCRGNNALGAKILNAYDVVLNTKLQVIDMQLKD